MRAHSLGAVASLEGHFCVVGCFCSGTVYEVDKKIYCLRQGTSKREGAHRVLEY